MFSLVGALGVLPVFFFLAFGAHELGGLTCGVRQTVSECGASPATTRARALTRTRERHDIVVMDA
jgi:hypothetical protein